MKCILLLRRNETNREKERDVMHATQKLCEVRQKKYDTCYKHTYILTISYLSMLVCMWCRSVLLPYCTRWLTWCEMWLSPKALLYLSTYLYVDPYCTYLHIFWTIYVGRFVAENTFRVHNMVKFKVHICSRYPIRGVLHNTPMQELAAVHM